MTTEPTDLREARRSMSPEERFWSYVNKTDECWLWTGGLNQFGYGQFTPRRGEHVRSHRYAYSTSTGTDLRGKILDHLCRNRACVRPDHLEIVTNRENVLRGEGHPAVNARKTHCPRGHEYTEENTYRTPKGFRHCRKCQQIRTERVACPVCGKELSRRYLPPHVRNFHKEES